MSNQQILMDVAIKRFLAQLIRHNRQDYNLLDEPFRQRYALGENQLFADAKNGSEAHRLLRQQVADDRYYLIKIFANKPKDLHRDSYKAISLYPEK